MKHFKDKLSKRKQTDSLRSLLEPQAHMIDFCSNDYLGIAKSIHFSEPYKMGSSGSRLLSGHDETHHQTETFISTFHGMESALLFNSGYTANLGLLSTICERSHVVLYDELCHASIRDGLQLCKGKHYSFHHNDLEDLAKKLTKWATADVIWVVTESVFSMDGDCAPLTPMGALCELHGAKLIVDEAHAIGIFGKDGQGLVHELNLQHHVFALIVTFGKALGSHGAAILGNHLLKEYLINYCRPFIYTTAMSPFQAAHILHNYKLLQNIKAIDRLKSNIAYFKKCMANMSNLIPSQSAIQSIIIPGNNHVKSTANSLIQLGFDVRPILSPTVPAGKERLRICLHAFNTEKEILDLTKNLENLV